MRDPHVRFCERHGGVIPRAYSTAKPDRRETPATAAKSTLPQPAADGHSKNTPASARQDLNAVALYCRM
jgi:hypothetical protein